MFRIILSLFLFSFTLSGCNTKSTNDFAQDQLTVKSESPLGAFLANSNKSAVLKFYADWCSTCKSYEPVFNKISAEYKDKVDFYSIDVDKSEYKNLIKQLKISRIPETVFVNQDRTSVVKKLGAIRRKKLEAIVLSQLD
jgi:thioredoxin 1